MKNKGLVLWIAMLGCLCLAASCLQERQNTAILRARGFGDTMKKRLKPLILKTPFPVMELGAVGLDNCLATLNKTGEFSLLTIDEAGMIGSQVLSPGFPGQFGEFRTDSTYNVLWIIRGRGVYALDMASGKTAHFIASNNGNDKILTTLVAQNDPPTLLVNVAPPYPLRDHFVLFDLKAGKVVYESELYTGVLFPRRPGELLFGEFYGEKGNLIRWQYTDLTLKPGKATPLTKALNKAQLDIYPRTRNYHWEKRILFGTNRVNKELIYYTARWELSKEGEEEEAKVEPLLLQKPPKSLLHARAWFSPDGVWLKTVLEDQSGMIIDPPELVVYHVSSIYPQGLSLPIRCGFTKDLGTGAFVRHRAWGMCYTEADPALPGKLFVYKLEEGLKILAEEAASSL